MDIASGYCSQLQARVEHLLANDQLKGIQVEDWVTIQTAALLRLGA